MQPALYATPSKRGTLKSGGGYQHHEKRNVSYRVSVHTSDIPGAGTSARIFLFMSGSDGVTTPVSLPGVYDRATKVTNTFVGEDVGAISRIEIGHDGSGARTKWHMSYVEVTCLSGSHRGETYMFVYDDWLSARTPGDLAKVRLKALHPARRNVYKVIVRTADVEGAGTNRRIYVRLKGYDGLCSEQLELTAPGRKSFQPGNSDVFLLDLHTLSLGKIGSIDIGFMPLRDDEVMNEDDEWSLRSVTIIYLNTGESTEFEYNQTIAWNIDRKNARLNKFLSRKGGSSTPTKPGRSTPTRPQLPALDEDEDSHSHTGSIRSRRLSDDSKRGSSTPAKAQLQATEVDRSGPSLPTYVKKSATKELHTYRVVVLTSDVRNAGIDCRVFLTIFGRYGNTNVTTLPGEFERNSKVEITFTDVDVGEISSIRVGHDGTGIAESWHLCYVTVEDLNSTYPKQIFFLNSPIRRRRAGDSVEVELFPVGKSRNIYRVIVRTSDVEGAGTNKMVTIRMAGRRINGITEEYELNADRNKFDRGSVDVFYIDLGSIRLGTILGIDIGYKDQLTEDDVANYEENNLVDWHLDSVTIEHMNTGKKAEFQYNDWLLNLQAKLMGKKAMLANPLANKDASKETAKLQQDMEAALEGMKAMKMGDEGAISYRVQIYTSHIPGSGTHGKVAVTIFGSLGTTEKIPIPGNFTDGSMVEYLLSHEDIGGIKKIAVEHGDKAADDQEDDSNEWRLSRIVVQPMEGDEALQRSMRRCFLHNGWLAGSGVVKVNLMPLHMDSQMFRVTVKTSNREQPGVAGPISIRLRGSKGAKSSEMDLTTSVKAFQKGSEDTFFINLGSLNLGKIDAVDIGYRSTWEPLAEEKKNHIWHMDWVEVEHLASGDTMLVNYRRWITASMRARSGFIEPTDELEPEDDLPVDLEALAAAQAAAAAAAAKEDAERAMNARKKAMADAGVGVGLSEPSREMHLPFLPVLFKNGLDDNPDEPDFQIYNNYLVTGDGASDAGSEGTDLETLMEPLFMSRQPETGTFPTNSDGQPMQPLLEELIAPPLEIGMGTGKKIFYEPEAPQGRQLRESLGVISESGGSVTNSRAPPFVIPYGLTIPSPVKAQPPQYNTPPTQHSRFDISKITKAGSANQQ